jgi:hypothetical protein
MTTAAASVRQQPGDAPVPLQVVAFSAAARAWLARNVDNTTPEDVAKVIFTGHRHWPGEGEVGRTYTERRPARHQAPLVVEADVRDNVCLMVFNVYRDVDDRADLQAGPMAFQVTLSVHARERMVGRQVPASAIHAAMAHGTSRRSHNDTTVYVRGSGAGQELVVVAADSEHVVTVYYRAAPRFQFSRNYDGQRSCELRAQGKCRDLARERVVSQRRPWS